MIKFLLLVLLSQTLDRSPKPCIVTEIVVESVRSDCSPWKPVKGDRLIMPDTVRTGVKVGDTFYFVYQKDLDMWVAELSKTKKQDPTVAEQTSSAGSNSASAINYGE